MLKGRQKGKRRFFTELNSLVANCRNRTDDLLSFISNALTVVVVFGIRPNAYIERATKIEMMFFN